MKLEVVFSSSFCTEAYCGRVGKSRTTYMPFTDCHCLWYQLVTKRKMLGLPGKPQQLFFLITTARFTILTYFVCIFIYLYLYLYPLIFACPILLFIKEAALVYVFAAYHTKLSLFWTCYENNNKVLFVHFSRYNLAQQYLIIFQLKLRFKPVVLFLFIFSF